MYLLCINLNSLTL